MRVQAAARVLSEAHGEGIEIQNRKGTEGDSGAVRVRGRRVPYESNTFRPLWQLALCRSSNTVLCVHVSLEADAFITTTTPIQTRTQDVVRCFVTNFLQNRFFCSGTDDSQS